MVSIRHKFCVASLVLFFDCACVRAQILDVRLVLACVHEGYMCDSVNMGFCAEAPPKRPLPQVAAEVSVLEGQRENAEKEPRETKICIDHNKRVPIGSMRVQRTW